MTTSRKKRNASGKTRTDHQKLSASHLAEIALDAKDHERRIEALAALHRLGDDARFYVPAIIALFADDDEGIRYSAYQILSRFYPNLPRPLLDAFQSFDCQERLAGIREIVRLLPDVKAAIVARRPGWQTLDGLTGGSTGEESAFPRLPEHLRQSGDNPEQEDDVTKVSRTQPDDPVAAAMSERPGSWIAWNKAGRTIIAIADTYAEALSQASSAGEADPEIERAPGVHPVAAARPFTLLEDESPNVIADVKKIIPDAIEWLDTPNTNLGFEKPRDLIGTDRERQLRYLLRGIRNGITT